MKHDDLKKQLLQNPETKSEYESLQMLYVIKSEIIKLRLERGLSQKDLAELIGSKQSAISRLESGDYNPSIEFLNKVAVALGKKPQSYVYLTVVDSTVFYFPKIIFFFRRKNRLRQNG